MIEENTESVSCSAVIVTHNSSQVLPALFSSLRVYEPETSIVVVDNASPEGLPAISEGVSVIQAKSNLGYAGACNVGLRALAENPPKFVAFVNPDVRLTGPALTEVCLQMNQHPNCGIATGSLIDASGERVPSAWGEASLLRLLWRLSGLRLLRIRSYTGVAGLGGPFTSSQSLKGDAFEVDGFVIGGAMVVRWDCIHDIGGFDAGYFMSWDDADLCRRARDRGWEIWQFPTSSIMHLGSASSAGVVDENWDRWYLEGAARYSARHLGPLRRLGFKTVLSIWMRRLSSSGDRE